MGAGEADVGDEVVGVDDGACVGAEVGVVDCTTVDAVVGFAVGGLVGLSVSVLVAVGDLVGLSVLMLVGVLVVGDEVISLADGACVGRDVGVDDITL